MSKFFPDNYEIRERIYRYSTEDFRGLIITPKALRDQPLPGLNIPFLAVSRAITREVYELLGLNNHVLLHVCQSQMVRRLERVTLAPPPITGLSELLYHLPLFTDVTIATIGANQSGVAMFDHLTLLLRILVDSQGSKVKSLKLDFTTAVLRLGALPPCPAMQSPWNAMCISLGPLAQALHDLGGRIMVCLGTRSTPLIRWRSQGPTEIDFEDEVVAGHAAPRYYSQPYTSATADMVQNLWNAIAQAGTFRIYSRTM